MLTVSISGPRGAGKTRLLRVIAAALEHEGHSLCTFDGGDSPLRPRPVSAERRADFRPFPVVILTIETPTKETNVQCQ